MLREVEPLPDSDVLLVDSASSDGTAERAARHPIRVLKLAADQPLTPAAGRFVGFQQTAGELVLFLDGDMMLCPGWLEQAIDLMQERPEVAGVCGQLLERPPGSPAEPLEAGGGKAPSSEVRHSGGAVLHRRSALDEVGPFNPHLRSDEEPELCIRLRGAGYRVVRLERPAAYHFATPSEAISTLLARRRRGLYIGAGQAIRHNLGTGALWPYVRERGFGLVPGIGLAAGVAALLAATRTGRRGLLGAWLATFGGFLAIDVWRKRSPYRTLFSLVLRLMILEGTIRGFLRTPLPPAAYPARFEMVQATPSG